MKARGNGNDLGFDPITLKLRGAVCGSAARALTIIVMLLIASLDVLIVATAMPTVLMLLSGAIFLRPQLL